MTLTHMRLVTQIVIKMKRTRKFHSREVALQSKRLVDVLGMTVEVVVAVVVMPVAIEEEGTSAGTGAVETDVEAKEIVEIMNTVAITKSVAQETRAEEPQDRTTKSKRKKLFRKALMK